MANDPVTRPIIRLRPGEQRSILFIGDFLVAAAAVFVGIYIWSLGDPWVKFSFEFFRLRVPWWFYGIPALWLAMLIDIYELHRAANWRRTVRSQSAKKKSLFFLIGPPKVPPN